MSKQGKSIKAKLLVIFVALLILPVPTSSQTDNCCFVDRQCNTDEQWISGWWAFQNNQCAAPSQQNSGTSSQSQPQPGTSENTDNCCFVDRQCMTDEEWVNGYNAFQDNQCAAPSQQQQSRSSQSQPQTDTSEDIDNCCFSGWQCSTDEEWESGYFASQHNQCDSSQSHWQGQWQQLKQQQQQQQQQRQQQRRPSQGDRPQRQAQEQSSQNRNSASLGDEPGTYQATIDLSNPEDSTHELEDGTDVVIVNRPPLTCEQILEAFPDWPLCL